MTVNDLIQLLSKLPADAKIFYGSFYGQSQAVDGVQLVELYEVEPELHEKVWSCGSGAPWKRHIENNVVILETT